VLIVLSRHHRLRLDHRQSQQQHDANVRATSGESPRRGAAAARPLGSHSTQGEGQNIVRAAGPAAHMPEEDEVASPACSVTAHFKPAFKPGNPDIKPQIAGYKPARSVLGTIPHIAEGFSGHAMRKRPQPAIERRGQRL
jgi:hypothetical protein